MRGMRPRTACGFIRRVAPSVAVSWPVFCRVKPFQFNGGCRLPCIAVLPSTNTWVSDISPACDPGLKESSFPGREKFLKVPVPLSSTDIPHLERCIDLGVSPCGPGIKHVPLTYMFHPTIVGLPPRRSTPPERSLSRCLCLNPRAGELTENPCELNRWMQHHLDRDHLF